MLRNFQRHDVSDAFNPMQGVYIMKYVDPEEPFKEYLSPYLEEYHEEACGFDLSTVLESFNKELVHSLNFACVFLVRELSTATISEFHIDALPPAVREAFRKSTPAQPLFFVKLRFLL